MSYGFIMGLSMACTMLGISLKDNAVEKLAAEGPLSLYEISIHNPNSGPLKLLVLYSVRRMGPYILILHLLWPVALDLAVGALYEHTSKKFLREMARLLNRYLKDPDKQPYKRKALSLVISCFMAPGISVLVYIQRRMTIVELFLFITYFYLLQSQHAPYTACISTALIMLDPNYFPIAVFTSIYCFSWTLFVPKASTRRYRNYIFKVFGRLLHVVILQMVLLGVLIIPFALVHDKSMDLSAFFINRMHTMFLLKPEPLTHMQNTPIPLPSFWDIVDFLKVITPGRLDGLTDYMAENNLWVWTAVTVVVFTTINLSVMCMSVRRNVSMDPMYPVLSCFGMLTSFVVFVPERSFTVILPMLTAIYCILLNLISTTSQMATQKGLEYATATERTHLGLHPVATQRGLMRQGRMSGRCRCTRTNRQLEDIVNIIPTSLTSIRDTPFVCLGSDNLSYESDKGHPFHHKWLKSYNSLRYRSLSRNILENRDRMIAHSFNDIFLANELDLDNNVYKALSARDRRKKADQASSRKIDDSPSALKCMRDERGDNLFGDDEMFCNCLSGMHLLYLNKNIRDGISTAGSRFLDFLEEYGDRLSHLLPLILQMLFAFYNMYSSVQNTGIVRKYSQIFNLASFLALRRAFKEDEKTLVWSLPFLCVDIFGIEWLLLNKGVKVALALFIILCSTALMTFVGFKYLAI